MSLQPDLDYDYSYNGNANFEEISRHFLESFNIPQKSRLLEIGFGDGKFISALHQLRPDIQCYGTEVNARAVQYAQKTFPWLKIVSHKKGVTLDLETGSCDGAVCMFVLEALLPSSKKIKTLVSEAARVLKPDGFFCVTVGTVPDEAIELLPHIEPSSYPGYLTVAEWTKLLTREFRIRRLSHYQDDSLVFECVRKWTHLFEVPKNWMKE